MKPEPVRPLHGSIPRAQKNCKLPLISKKVGRGPQPLPLRCRQELSRHRLPEAKFALSGQNKALESALQVEIQNHFPQSIKPTAAEPAPKGDHQSPCPQQRAEPRLEVHVGSPALPTLGNQSSPTVAALISNPRDGWNFP